DSYLKNMYPNIDTKAANEKALAEHIALTKGTRYATKGQQFEKLLAAGHPGLLFPFLLTFLLKTAQGSSTVAIITAASIIHPLVPALGLSGPHANLFCVLAMGAGSMMISHANDAYFWVITRFSGLDMRSMLKVYSVATLLMGLMAMTATYLLYWLFP
ncbi:MAG: GntP family permease, partial [Bacteroidota bacterium]|nr:GntP family permease [Bacteroidota bacterium]